MPKAFEAAEAYVRRMGTINWILTTIDAMRRMAVLCARAACAELVEIKLSLIDCRCDIRIPQSRKIRHSCLGKSGKALQCEADRIQLNFMLQQTLGAVS